MANIVDPFKPTNAKPASAGIVDPFAPRVASSLADLKPAEPTPEEPGFFSAVGEGFRRTMPQTRELLGAAQIGFGQLVGSEGITAGGVERFEAAKKETEALRGASLGDVTDGNAGFGEWAGDVLGNFGGQALQSGVAAGVGALIGGGTASAVPVAGTAAGAITGAAAGIIGRKSLMAGARKLATEYIESQVEKGVARDVAEAGAAQIIRKAGVGAAAKVAAVAAPLALNSGQEIGAAVSNRIDSGVAPEDITPGQAAQAIGAGGVAGVIDTATEAFGAAKMFGAVATQAKGVLGRVAREAVAGAVREGATEVAQSGLERAGGGISLTDEAARNEYLESGAAGALGGGVLGGGIGAFRRPGAQATPAPQIVNPATQQTAPQETSNAVPEQTSKTGEAPVRSSEAPAPIVTPPNGIGPTSKPPTILSSEAQQAAGLAKLDQERGGGGERGEREGGGESGREGTPHTPPSETSLPDPCRGWTPKLAKCGKPSATR